MDGNTESPLGKEIKEKFDALPQHLKDYVYSTEMSKVIQTIAAKHSLHIDQAGELEAETAAAMMGVTKVEELEENLASALELDAQKAAAVTKDINEMLFVKIREDMKASAEPKAAPDVPKMPLAAQLPVPTPASTPQVVMPSSSAPVVPPAPAPAAAPTVVPAPPPAPAPAPKPAMAPNLGAADAILSEKKVTPSAAAPIPAAPTTPAASPVSKVDPTQPQNYKADPYREPVE